MSSVKLPISSIDVIPQGLHLSELAGKSVKKLSSLLSSFKKACNDKTLKIIFFLEDDYEEIYLRSDNVDEDGDVDIFHDLVDAKKSPHAEKQILFAKTFPDSILCKEDGKEDVVILVIRVNIGGGTNTGLDLDSHGSTMARILRQSYARHDRKVQSDIYNQHKQYIVDTILNPQHSKTNATGQMEK